MPALRNARNVGVEMVVPKVMDVVPPKPAKDARLKAGVAAAALKEKKAALKAAADQKAALKVVADLDATIAKRVAEGVALALAKAKGKPGRKPSKAETAAQVAADHAAALALEGPDGGDVVDSSSCSEPPGIPTPKGVKTNPLAPSAADVAALKEKVAARRLSREFQQLSKELKDDSDDDHGDGRDHSRGGKRGRSRSSGSHASGHKSRHGRHDKRREGSRKPQTEYDGGSGSESDESSDYESGTDGSSSSRSGHGKKRGRVSSSISKSLFRHTPAIKERVDELGAFCLQTDGGATVAAFQAARTFKALAAYASNRDSATKAERHGVREWPTGVTTSVTPCSVGASEVALQLFALVPYKIMLRSMLNPRHMMPLGAISKAFDNNFGEHDALMGKPKRNEISAWSGTPMALISDLAKLMSIVSACDVQYGLALGGLLVVVADLLGPKKVKAHVVAKYIAYLRETAYERSGRDDVFKRFFVFDAVFFERAGGQLNSTGGVLVEADVTDAAKIDPALDGKGGANQRPSKMPFAGITCQQWNTGECKRGAACVFQHLCSLCHKGHTLRVCRQNPGRDKTSAVPAAAAGIQK